MSNPQPPAQPLAPLRDFRDWYSPMVVKEMRHGLRTRFFTTALILLHVLLALLMLTTLAGVAEQTTSSIFWGVAAVLLLGVMPLRGFAVLTAEARGGTMDMLTLTSISSFRIVYGKWAALFAQTLLVATSLLPYMVARYQFGGVQIPVEIAALVILVLASAVSTAALASFSSQQSILLRLFLLAVVVVFSLPFASIVLSAALGNFGDDIMRSFLDLLVWERVSLVAGVLLLTVYSVYVFLSLGASRVAPASENHSTIKRLIALGVLGLLTVVGCCLASFHVDTETALWPFVPALFLTLVIGVDVMTEAMPRFPTVAAPFVARGAAARLAGRLFLYPGWASGVVFYLTLCLAPLAILGCMWARSPSDFARGDPFLVVVLGLLAANLVPVSVRVYQTARFPHWWVVQFFIISLGIFIMTLVEVTGMKGLRLLGLVTPGTAIISITSDWSTRSEYAASGMIVGSLWVLSALALASLEMRTYRRLEAEVATLNAPQTVLTHEPA